MSTPYRARAEAASRLPPLASGRRDPVLQPADKCYVCLGRPAGAGQLVYIFHRWMCRDRVDCYQRYKGQP